MDESSDSTSSLPISETSKMIAKTESEEFDLLLSSLTCTKNDKRHLDKDRMNKLARDKKIELLKKICMLPKDGKEHHQLILEYLVTFAIQECNRVSITENEKETLFECLSLLTTNHPTLIYPHIPILISFFCQIVRLSPLNCRRAMILITVLYESHPHLIPGRKKEEILQCSLIVEEPKGETSEWLAMDSLDLPIKPAHWFERILSVKNNEQNGKRYFNMMDKICENRDWKKRYSGLLGWFTVGGYRREVKNNITIGDLEGRSAVATSTILLKFINDEHPRIRSLVCQALEHMATVYPALFQMGTHETVPSSLLFTVLRDDSPRVVGHALHALTVYFRASPAFVASPNFIKGFEVTLAKAHKSFLLEKKSLLINEIVSLLSVVTSLHLAVYHEGQNKQKKNGKRKKTFDGIFSILKLILKQCPELSNLTRVTIFQCIAYIGLMIGKEKFCVQDICDILRSILPLFSSLNPLDPECSLILNPLDRILVNLDKNSLSPLFPQLLPPIISMAGIQVYDEETGSLKIKVHFKEVMKVKKRACMILTKMACNLGVSFRPYVEEVSKAMIDNLAWFDRHKNVDLIEESVASLSILFSLREESFRSIWIEYWMIMKELMKTRMGAHLTNHCIESVASCVQHMICPEDINEEELREVGDLIKEKLEDILQREELKWTVEEMERPSDMIKLIDDKEVESDNDKKAESVLLDSISSLFSAVIEKGHSCNDMIDSVIPLVFSLIDRYDDKEWGVSILASIIQHSPHSGINYHLEISDLFFKSISDDNPVIRHEAAFSFGEMALSGIPEWMGVASHSIYSLSSMIDRPDSRSTDDSILATENAISSITKIITNCEVEEGTVNNILSRFIHWLPISEDEEEAQFVYGFLADLIEEKNGVILGEGNGNSPKILRILTKVVKGDILDSTPESLLVKERLVSIIKMKDDQKSIDM